MSSKKDSVVKRFNDLILIGVRKGFSDLHFTGGQFLAFRKDGIIYFDKTVRWNHKEIDTLVINILNPRHLQVLRQRWSVDFSMSVSHVRIRVNVFNTTRGLSLAVRLLPGTIPPISRLNLHPSLQQICEIKAGLVLICGSTGCGKTTTIAAIIDEINRTRSAHIITLEDPIEFRFLSKKSFIEQRELGTHIPSFQQGLLDVLREDPDVIVIGELREPETIRLTLNAAESGHLVIASLHATNSEDAIYRINNSFPPEAQEEIRFQIASTLSWVVIQQLVYLERVMFRVPILSILKGTQSVKGVIREGKLPQIENIIHTGKNEGMFTMERYLKEYINERASFIHPSQNFMPSEESASDIIYTSTLLTRDITQNVVYSTPAYNGQVRLGHQKQVHQIPISKDDTHDDLDQDYTIVDDTNLEELIAQIEQLEDT